MLIYQKVFQTTKNQHSKLHIQSYICVAWWVNSPAMVGKLPIFEPSKSPWSNPEPCKIPSIFVTAAAHHSGFYQQTRWDLPWICHGVDMVFRGNQGTIPSEGWRSPFGADLRQQLLVPDLHQGPRSKQLPTGTIGTTFHVSWSLNQSGSDLDDIKCVIPSGCVNKNGCTVDILMYLNCFQRPFVDSVVVLSSAGSLLSGFESIQYILELKVQILGCSIFRRRVHVYKQDKIELYI